MNQDSAGKAQDLSLSVNQLIILTTEGDRRHNEMLSSIESSLGTVFHITLGDPHKNFTEAYQSTPLRMAACIAKNCIIVGAYKSYFVKHKDGVLLGMASPAEYVAESTVWHSVLEYCEMGVQ